jgi:hypothetical protein
MKLLVLFGLYWMTRFKLEERPDPAPSAPLWTGPHFSVMPISEQDERLF